MCGIIGVIARKTADGGDGGLAEAVRIAQAARTEIAGGADAGRVMGISTEMDHKSLACVNPWAIREIALRGPSPADEAASAISSALESLSARCEGASTDVLEEWNRVAVLLKDACWRFRKDIPELAERVKLIIEGVPGKQGAAHVFNRGFELASMLRSLDRLEVRGRDSAGMITVFTFRTAGEAEGFLGRAGGALLERMKIPNLRDGAVLRTVNPDGGQCLVFAHKVADEIGRLGQNVTGLLQKIRLDAPFLAALGTEGAEMISLGHTRWASNGIINEENCHPVDSRGDGAPSMLEVPVVFSVLNGDIDNYHALRREVEAAGTRVPPTVTTDAKIIPMVIEAGMAGGMGFHDAFRSAVTRFEGSFAIASICTSEPGKVLLAQKGSGQALYVGRSDMCTLFASEIYGMVELANAYHKMEDDGGKGGGSGRIFSLECRPEGACSLRTFGFDGRELALGKPSKAGITTRDIHRGEHEHFFLKEISESPDSFAKTIRGKFRVETDPETGFPRPVFMLSDGIVPPAVLESLKNGTIRNVTFIGQGTASIAGYGIAALFEEVFGRERFHVQAMKASELSGFGLRRNMSDTLVVAVSQSGTTTDTNRTVDLARKRGASVLAIVNRRNSDLTDKSDGVMYTSDGRDVEMSVASTKAFYCQVAAGYLVSLHLAHECGAMAEEEIARRLWVLGRLPDLMRQTLADREKVRAAAEGLAPSKRHWAVVGSGFDKVSAEEIRIKLSELNYKSISCDVTEDKKHIDLSSEPLIIVCAAGVPESNLGDIVKEVSIFKAHRACPVVIAQEGQPAFSSFASAVLTVRRGAGELSFLLSTMVGHLFGYYAARATDESAQVMRATRAAIVAALPEIRRRSGFALAQTAGLLARQVGVLGQRFRDLVWKGSYNSALEVETSTRILALYAYAAGRTRLQDVKYDFGITPRWDALYDEFLMVLSKGIGELTRPIDAIKHQAKTVTVGISREEVKFTGVLFRMLGELGISPDQIDYSNLNVIEHVSEAISEVLGFTLYSILGLDETFRRDENTTIAVERRQGVAGEIESRYSSPRRLAGTKLSVMARGRVFIGTGKRDRRAIAIIPTIVKREDTGAMPMILFHVSFRKDLPLDAKVKILRNYYERYEEIRWAAGEIMTGFDDSCLDGIPIEELLETSPDILAEKAARRAGKPKAP